ncbi:MAG: sulfurtransferase TusA family protein [Armatimonadota bacterium]
MNRLTYKIPQSVVEDTLAYRGEVEKFLAGNTPAVAFRAIRVPIGIYEQRENDTYMVRVRGASGVFMPDQIKIIANLAAEFGNGIIHVTTRQDLQIHRVLIQDTPTVLEKLLDARLSSRGGGGNTVRNISACPLAGACPKEDFDVTPYALALTEYLITNRANFNLPRKFKAAFSGCGDDCGLASVADLGFFAHVRDGIRGFSVYAGGGLGANPALAVKIEEFVPTESIFEVAEAVKRLFDKYGDRTNRSKARLHFVVERVGQDEFRRLYRDELDGVRKEGIIIPEINLTEDNFVANRLPLTRYISDIKFDSWKSKNVSAQKQEGLYAVKVPLPLGDIRSDALIELAELAVNTADGTVRTTQSQDLQLRGVQESDLYELYARLKDLDERFVKATSVSCVACAGASTCKLGLCLSRGLSDAIESEVGEIDLPFNTSIRISGCPNSCGHHPIAQIGLYGVAVRVNGRLLPYYTVMAGGRLAEGESTLAKSLGRVPARAIPALIREFVISASQNQQENESFDDLLNRWGIYFLRTLLPKYEAVPSYEESPEFYHDFGSDEDFSLAGRGPGECGAGVMDIIALDIDEAKGYIKENALYKAVVSTARALLVIRGLEPKKDREVFASFTELLITPGWVDKRAQAVLDAAVDYKLGDRDSLDDLKGDIQSILDRVEQLFRSLDSNLNFRIEPVHEADVTETDPPGNPVTELDLRGVACPMNFVRAKLKIEDLEIGDVLNILLDAGEPAKNVPASFADQGHEVLSVDDKGTHFSVQVRKSI